MILGPVFRTELVRTSRRRRYYFMRLLYGLALLLLIWSRFESLLMASLRNDGRVLISEAASFALSTFLTFAVLQLLTLLALIPALFGGVIADEKERKTIHYLMASRLSSGEIVLDKFLARLLHVAVFVLVGMPVLSLLSLFGGIPWEYIIGVYGGTFSVIFFTASLATLVSTLARRVRQGVLIAYLMVIFWLVVPSLADIACSFVYPKFYLWFGPVNAWFRASSPISFLSENMYTRTGPTRGGPMVLLDSFLWMVGLQTVAGLVFLLLAVHQLRPTFRRQETGTRRVTWFKPKPKQRRPRWTDRPACGTDAMLWKECHFTRTDVFTKLVVLPATILLTVAVLLTSGVDEWLWGSFRELIHQGYRGNFGVRNKLNEFLRAISPIYIGLWLLAVAGAAASSLTVEREEDTWISLTSTPLRGWEILRGKMIGAIWGLRGFGALIGLFWLVGLLTGALHPLGFLLGLLLVALFTWTVAALGTYASLTARSTSHALTMTIVTLVMVNGGFLTIVVPLLMAVDPYLRMLVVPPHWENLQLGCTPYLTTFALISFDDLGSILGTADPSLPPISIDWEFIAFALVVLAAHGSAALFLTTRANRQFDAIVDRPR